VQAALNSGIPRAPVFSRHGFNLLAGESILNYMAFYSGGMGVNVNFR
jgi:hypothetical protein